VKWRRLTRLEGMLLGALVELTERAPARAEISGDRPLCCRGFLIAQDQCSRCGPLLRGRDLVEKVLKMQRTPPKKRDARKPAPRRRFPNVSKMPLGRGGLV